MANLYLTCLHMRSHLSRVRTTADGFMACCPAHEDRSPSLTVTVTHERILLKCMAGCATADIITRMGLDWPDLFADGVESHRHGPRPRPLSPPKPATAKEDPPPDYGPLLTAARAMPQHRQRLLELADELGALPESREAYADAAEAVGVVWLTRNKTLAPHLPYKGRGWVDCWAIPERDGDGRVIGVSRRYPGGGKKQMAGGKRGLVYAPHLPPTAGPILCPEGASDTIALLACGLCAAGRPSNTGGAKLLADLLCDLPAGTTIVILGENDKKGDKHPGREGMEKIASEMANSLPLPVVQTALPEQPAKDARQWVAGRSGGDVGAAFLASLDLRQVYASECPRIPIESNDQEYRECTDTHSCPLSLLPEPPPAFACTRGGSSLLHHTVETGKHRTSRHACDSWSCPVCRARLAHQWVTHLAQCADAAAQSGCRLVMGEFTRDRLDKAIAAALRRRGGEWAALEVVPGIYEVIAALPAGESIPEGMAEVSYAQACERMVRWAGEVRLGPDPFAKKNKKCRPVRTSKGWQINREEPVGEWEVVCPVDTRDIEVVAKIVRDERARVVADTTGPGERRGGGSSLIWLLEWRADPETAERITRRLRSIVDGEECPPVRVRRPDEDDYPDPFAGVI